MIVNYEINLTMFQKLILSREESQNFILFKRNFLHLFQMGNYLKLQKELV